MIATSAAGPPNPREPRRRKYATSWDIDTSARACDRGSPVESLLRAWATAIIPPADSRTRTTRRTRETHASVVPRRRFRARQSLPPSHEDQDLLARRAPAPEHPRRGRFVQVVRALDPST